jgi:esterase/lipase
MIQGSDDKCVSPQSVSKLAKHIKSEDQTIRWFYAYGHLAFETDHLRAAVLSSLINWFRNYKPEFKPDLERMEQEIVQLGGTVR